MTQQQQDAAKRAAGEAAARLVEDGMRVGIGTGSTAAFATAALGRRIKEKQLRVVGVPTSIYAGQLAREQGIPLATLDEVERLDLTFDGADEVDSQLNLIKGRGAALTGEKVIASVSERYVVMIDPTKRVERLGARMPLPVEFLPMAAAPVRRAIERLGGKPELRMGVHKDGPVVTDQGFWIFDVRFEAIDDPEGLANELIRIPGVLEHGLVLNMATDVLIGESENQVTHLER